MKPFNSVFSSYGTTVFEVVSQLAREHQAINLGQGYPDEDGPDPCVPADRDLRIDPRQTRAAM